MSPAGGFGTEANQRTQLLWEFVVWCIFFPSVALSFTLALLISLRGSLYVVTFNCRYAFAPLLCVGKVGLPGTVEAHESVGGVPESVWKKVQAVKLGGGGLAELEEKVIIHNSSIADIL